MSLDTKLILDAMSKLFDRIDTRWAKEDATREAARGVPIPTQSASVETNIVADNWSSLFDGGDASDAPACVAPASTVSAMDAGHKIVQCGPIDTTSITPAWCSTDCLSDGIDLWESISEVPTSTLVSAAPIAKDEGISSSTKATTTIELSLASTTPSLPTTAAAPASILAPAVSSAEDEATNDSPSRCSMQVLSSDLALLASPTLCGSSLSNNKHNTKVSDLLASIDCSIQVPRYTTSMAPFLSNGIVLLCVDIGGHEYEKVLESITSPSIVMLGTVPAHVFDKEQWPPPLFETIQLCFSFCLPIRWANVQHRPPWPPPMQCEVQVDDIHIRPAPWPSFSSLVMEIQWEKGLSRMFCYSISRFMMKLRFENISGDCLQYCLKLYGNALQIGGTKWRDSILLQFIGGPYAHLKKMGGQFSTFPDRANLATLQSHSVNCCWMQWEIPWPLAAMECWFGDGILVIINLQILLQRYTNGVTVCFGVVQLLLRDAYPLYSSQLAFKSPHLPSREAFLSAHQNGIFVSFNLDERQWHEFLENELQVNGFSPGDRLMRICIGKASLATTTSIFFGGSNISQLARCKADQKIIPFRTWTSESASTAIPGNNVFYKDKCPDVVTTNNGTSWTCGDPCLELIQACGKNSYNLICRVLLLLHMELQSSVLHCRGVRHIVFTLHFYNLVIEDP